MKVILGFYHSAISSHALFHTHPDINLFLAPFFPHTTSLHTFLPSTNPLQQKGACGGETACSTCHLYVDPAFFKKLPEISEAEEDMLDLAAGLKDNSRLGCQVFAAENIDGIIVEMPKEVNNLKG